MVVIGREKLKAFTRAHADAGAWIAAWLSEAETGNWKTPQDVKRRYATASFLGEGRVVFNIRGNNYRMVTQVRYLPPAAVLVRWIGTHAEYDETDATSI